MAQEKDGRKPAEPVEPDHQESRQSSEEPDPETSKNTESPADNPDVESDAEPQSETSSDTDTDQAVEDIVKKEGDDVLKAQDEEIAQAVVMKQGAWERFKNWNIAWWHNPRRRLSSIVGIVVLLGALFAVPFTRYNILGVALKSDVTVQVVDSKSGQPVSGATVELSGESAETQADGKAKLYVSTGTGSLKVSKKYYTGFNKNELVGGNNTFKASVVATGHQVSIKLVDKVTGKPVSGATVTASGAKAKTNKQGVALLVIPSGAAAQPATVTFGGYNDATISITATGNVAKNTFQLVPAGKLYFLSNLSGKLDVVKTNLDGTDRQTVLAGTGSEDKGSTSLLASRDWKYLALLSKRSGTTASVYLIDTTNGDKLTTIDEGNANFTLVGWSGDRFVYRVDRSATVADWQPNQEALKSFDATTGHTLLLDQTQGSGVSAGSYLRQYFEGAYLMDSQVVYTKNWSGNGPEIINHPSRQAELDNIGVDGSGHKVVKTFASSDAQQPNVQIFTTAYKPDSLYIQFYDGGNYNYFTYDNGSVTANTTLSDSDFYAGFPTYLYSPSGDQTFWADQRDGKNALFTGATDAKSPKQIASLSDYTPYGWYTDNYLLVSKNSSELYIMPVTGGTPQKITDYYKPSLNYQGYGGGYGGL